MKLLFRIFVFVMAVMALNSYFEKEQKAAVNIAKLDYHKVELAKGPFYFGLPGDIPVVMAGVNAGSVDYGDCHIDFAESMNKPKVSVANMEMEEDSDSDVHRVSYFSDEQLVAYGAYLPAFDLGFWSDAACAPKLEDILDTTTVKPVYLSEDFGYELPLLDGFEVVNMPNKEGVILKKTAEPKPEQDFNVGRKGPQNSLPYDVEIAFWGARNVADYQAIGDFVNEKYAGYTVDFIDLEGFTGVFVDELLEGDIAVRHFFALSANKRYFYEGYLKISKLNYLYHRDGFDSFVKSIRFF